MAVKAENKEKTYKVKITSNPNYCGFGPGSVAFANGEATTTSVRMAEWFKEHEGYEVTEA